MKTSFETLKQVDGMIEYITEEDDRTLMYCYIYRRVLDWTPKEVADRFGHSPVTVNSYAQRAAIVFDLPNYKHSIYYTILEACQNAVKLEQLKRQRNHLNEVSERLTKRLIKKA